MERLKELRIQQGKKQAEIAEYLNVGRNTISRYESGERVPDFETLIKLAEYFNTSVSYLVGETDNPTPIDKNSPLPSEEGNLILQQALAGTGLLDDDGNLSDSGHEVISQFIIKNADMLKKLMDEPD